MSDTITAAAARFNEGDFVRIDPSPRRHLETWLYCDTYRIVSTTETSMQVEPYRGDRDTVLWLTLVVIGKFGVLGNALAIIGLDLI